MPEDVKVGKAPDPKPPHRPFQKRKQLEQDIEHITQEMYRRNKELADTNKTLSLLRTIDALVLESHASLKMVCEHITEAITQVMDYSFVGLFTRVGHTPGQMRLYGWSGRDYLGAETPLGVKEPLHLKLEEEWLNQPRSQFMVSLESIPRKQILEFVDCSAAELDHLLDRLPLKSLYIVKLLVRRRVVGLLVLGFTTPVSDLSESDTLLIDRISDSVGVALDNKLLFEENSRIVRQLRESNTKLRALDEAKDDFVSMASHQMRTPLTSVKGYISMVLEGDAGKISEQQRKLLSQAFSSSQRMVYLIADLLNVSRLRTGKFMIERTPVNLAELAEQELEQLKTEATARSLKLHYKKPAKLPELMLDETKTRQLIMNFLDNAIYYSPAGKTIELIVEEKPSTVELRVVDHGIGVPRSEQHHLFTKFYRATNARHARPDGTGLGLFMAKKVIVAQGGSLIFESQEGRGSTFGFMLSKAKLAVPPADTAKN